MSKNVNNDVSKDSPLRWFNTITRLVDSVRIPNSLWHTDGLHCLIRWRFVIHSGINVFSRLIVYLSRETHVCPVEILKRMPQP